MDGDSKRCWATQFYYQSCNSRYEMRRGRVRKCVPWLGQNTPVAMACLLVPVAVVLDVLTVQVDDVAVDAAAVIVLLVVAHDVREMSAAITIQKKPALNNMTAVSFEGNVEYCNTDGAARGIQRAT